MTEVPQLLVRVKRRRDEEPVKELLVQQHVPDAKRRRPDTALRLVDSVESCGWSFETGLPASWMRDAPAPSESTPSLGCPRQSSERGPAHCVFRESQRRMVAGTFGEPVQLVDLERVVEQAPPIQKPVPSIFTLDGMPLVATPSESSRTVSQEVQQRDRSVFDIDDPEAFVWDVYALSDSALGGLDGGFPGFSARVQLTAPVFDDEAFDELEDLEDIDDSQSDVESWAGSGAPNDSSSAEGLEDDDRRWVDALD